MASITKKQSAFQQSQWKGKDQFAETPSEVMLALVEEFGLLNDVCPRDPQVDGLKVEWQRKNYMNPPYSKMEEWLTKAIEQWKMEKTIVALIPARTNCNWFHNYCIRYASEIRFIRQGIRFKGYKKKSPFPVAIVVFRAEDSKYAESEINTKIGSVNFYEKKRKIEEISTEGVPAEGEEGKEVVNLVESESKD